jgi:hypothetical protein
MAETRHLKAGDDEPLEQMVAEGRPRGMTRDEAVWYLGHNLKRWNQGEAVEAAAKVFTARMVKIYEAECAARGIVPGHVESVPGKGWVVTGQSCRRACASSHWNHSLCIISEAIEVVGKFLG